MERSWRRSSERGGSRPIPCEPARVEQLARELPDQGAIAARLGMGRSTLTQKLKSSPELRLAYERGRADRPEARLACAARAVELAVGRGEPDEIAREDGRVILAFIDEKLGARVWGEMRDECRQRLALALLMGRVRVHELTPATVGVFVRRVRRDLGDPYRHISFSSDLGERLAAVLHG